MTDVLLSDLALDDSFARAVPELTSPWQPMPVRAPELLVLNEELAAELGLDVAMLRSPEGVAILVGNAVAPGSHPVSQGYAGHQFGGLSPRLGDGRAVLLGELTDRAGRRRDLHLKGSGRTTWARGGDGRAAVGPMLREYLVGEAMHALGIPTTRALAVTATGEPVPRDVVLPGAVLARVAASHLRVGSFVYAALQGDDDLLRRLADLAIDRHHPAARDAANPYLALFERVLAAQADLVARWMAVGFIHGVMNTDNTTISGETIDYGPCAFIDRFDPATVFSSIDHGGRYAYGNQPQIIQWNLARLAEAMLPLLDDDTDAAIALATERLQGYPEVFRAAWLEVVRPKLGLSTAADGDDQLVADLLDLLEAEQLDVTLAFRTLAAVVDPDGGRTPSTVAAAPSAGRWIERYRARVTAEGRDPAAVAAAMDQVNPLYVPRNHRVEEALAAATAGDLEPFHRLVDVVTHPFDERPGLEAYAEPAPLAAPPYQTFCGT